MLYRTAEDAVNRDMHLLVSRDGTSFRAQPIDKWEVPTCVMSSASLHSTDTAVFAAWETEQQVKFARVDHLAPSAPPAMIVPKMGSSSRKHPVIAVDAQGQTILVWTEGTGWKKGGDVAWQVFDKAGQPLPSGAGVSKGVPVWSFAAVYARPDGGFTVVY